MALPRRRPSIRHKSQAIVCRYIDEADRLIDNPILKITEDSH